MRPAIKRAIDNRMIMMNTTNNQSRTGEAMKAALDKYRAQLAEPATETFIETCQRMSKEGYEYNYDSGYFEMTWEECCRLINGDVSG
jgi:hypothetical protein